MDLSLFNFSGTGDMAVCHPDTGADLSHDGKPMIMKIFGEDAPARIAAQREYSATMRETNLPGVDVDQKKDDALCHFTAKIIAGWENIVWGDKPLPFNFENALMLVRRKFIFEQITIFAGTRGGFLSEELRA